MQKLEKEILQLINQENNDKRDFPEEGSEEDQYYAEMHYWTREQIVQTPFLKEYTGNEILSAVERLEKSGKIITMPQGRLMITSEGQKEILSGCMRLGKYLINNLIAILALAVSILALIIKTR